MKNIDEIAYCSHVIENNMKEIREIDHIISHLETIVCDEVYYEDALKLLLANNRHNFFYEVFIEQLKAIAASTKKRIASYEGRLKAAVNTEDYPFTSEQLYFIRDEFACIMEKTGNANDELDIINTCNRILDCPTFDSYEQWERNTSDTWEEIREDAEDGEDGEDREDKEDREESACYGCHYNIGNTCFRHEPGKPEDCYVSEEEARMENQKSLP